MGTLRLVAVFVRVRTRSLARSPVRSCPLVSSATARAAAIRPRSALVGCHPARHGGNPGLGPGPTTARPAGQRARGEGCHWGGRRTARSRWAREALSLAACARVRRELVGWATGGVARGGVHGWGWRLRTRVATPREPSRDYKGMLRTCFARVASFFFGFRVVPLNLVPNDLWENFSATSARFAPPPLGIAAIDGSAALESSVSSLESKPNPYEPRPCEQHGRDARYRLVDISRRRSPPPPPPFDLESRNCLRGASRGLTKFSRNWRSRLPPSLPSSLPRSLPLLQNYARNLRELCSRDSFSGSRKKGGRKKKKKKRKRRKRRPRKTWLGLGYFHPRATNRDPRGAPSPLRRTNDLFQRPLGFDINDFSGPQGETSPRNPSREFLTFHPTPLPSPPTSSPASERFSAAESRACRCA